MSRLDNLEHYYKVAAEDLTAVKKLEAIEAQALQKMQQTIKMENTHTERIMSRLESDKNHRAFFLAAANKSQGDRSFDSESNTTKQKQSAKKTASGKKSKKDPKWKWKP
jgi:hypothetical protein